MAWSPEVSPNLATDLLEHKGQPEPETLPAHARPPHRRAQALKLPRSFRQKTKYKDASRVGWFVSSRPVPGAPHVNLSFKQQCLLTTGLFGGQGHTQQGRLDTVMCLFAAPLGRKEKVHGTMGG